MESITVNLPRGLLYKKKLKLPVWKSESGSWVWSRTKQAQNPHSGRLRAGVWPQHPRLFYQIETKPKLLPLHQELSFRKKFKVGRGLSWSYWQKALTIWEEASAISEADERQGQQAGSSRSPGRRLSEVGSSRKGRAEEEGQAVSRGVREFLSLAGQEAGPVCLCSPHPLQDARSLEEGERGFPKRWSPT